MAINEIKKSSRRGRWFATPITSSSRDKAGIKSESGQVAKILLVLLVIVVVAIGVAYMVTQKAQTPPTPVNNANNAVPSLAYEVTVNDIRFVFIEAINFGSILYGKDTKNPSWEKDIVTTEKFVRLVVAAQNVGTKNTENNYWDIGNIIDEKGREFVPSLQRVDPWLPEDDICGEILQPSFEPTPCTKIYEVARISKNLKVKVLLNKNGKKESGIIDIKLMP